MLPQTERPAVSDRTLLLTAVKAVIPLVLALLCVFVLSKYAVSPQFNAATIAALDDKKATVMELTAASTAASAAITLIPGDTATPIADKLADLSGCFLIVLCAIYLEKYLVTITGYAAFLFLFPAACLLVSLYVLCKKPAALRLAARLAVFGLAIILVIPVSVRVSGLIESTYSASIEETLDSARDATAGIASEAEEAEAEDEGFLSGLVSSVQDSVSGLTQQVESTLNRFIEALAVMLVTSCAIPILVLVFFFWLVKSLLGLDVALPRRAG